MVFRVINVDFIYNAQNELDSVNVRFDGDEKGDKVNGVTRVTVEEYNSTTNITELASLVKTKLKANLA